VSKRIVLIHAVTVAIQPILDAFKEGWPEAEITNLLDDGLTGALSREGALTPRIVQRICDLATYAAKTGADGILFTCSAFTPAMDVARQLVTIPVLKPDEAMISTAMDAGRRIGVLATLPATAPTQAAQLQAAAAERGKTIQVETAAIPEALKALNAGDAATHDRLIAEAAERLAHAVDVICLAQFSMARARPAVKAKVGVPVLTSPSSAVASLKAILTANSKA
jgi:Asp/Glu/hydantoin racemase